MTHAPTLEWGEKVVSKSQRESLYDRGSLDVKIRGMGRVGPDQITGSDCGGAEKKKKLSHCGRKGGGQCKRGEGTSWFGNVRQEMVKE